MKKYELCPECGEVTLNDDFVCVDDKYVGCIYMCPECLEAYSEENWPICFVAGYEVEING